MGWRKYLLSTMSVLLVLLLEACRQEPIAPQLPTDEDALITTDRERYTPDDFGDYVRYTVTATYTNTTEESVYLIPCGFEPPVYSLERFHEDTWRKSGYSLACPAVLAPSVEVASGTSLSATLQLDAFRLPNSYPQFGSDLIPGAHRLVFAITASVDDEGFANDDLLPLEQRVSNAFELEAP